MKYGPQTEQIEALIEKVRNLTPEQAEGLSAAWVAALDTAWSAAWDAARDTAWDTSWDAALDAAWDAVRDAAWDAVWDAILALLVKDQISEENFNILYEPWASVMEEAA